MNGPWPFHRYEVTYVAFCNQILVELPYLHLQYWYTPQEMEELAKAPHFFRPLYRFALTLIPEEAYNGKVDYVSEVLEELQHPERCSKESPRINTSNVSILQARVQDSDNSSD